jgi:hypothetical protein
MPHRSLLPVLILLVACGAQSAGTNAVFRESGAYLTLLEAPPYPPIERLGPEPVEQTLETRRWLHAERIEARELPLLRRIKSGAMGNFGGLEWRWRDGPENGGLGHLTGTLYFLRAPEETLRRYTSSPLYQAAQGDFARTDQERIVRQWAETIGRDVASEGFANMQVPTLNVALPRAEFERRAQAKGWRLPRNLMLRLDPRAEPDLPAISPDLAPLIRAFPHAQRLGGPTPDIATYDAIVVRDGCFFTTRRATTIRSSNFPWVSASIATARAMSPSGRVMRTTGAGWGASGPGCNWARARRGARLRPISRKRAMRGRWSPSPPSIRRWDTGRAGSLCVSIGTGSG